MSDEVTYSLHVHPGTLTEECVMQTVPATKRTTASEVVNKVVSRLDLNEDLSYVLVELHNHKGEEMVLDFDDHPVQRMLLWPLQFQHTYKFILRQTDKDGSVVYNGAPIWQAKADRDLTQRSMAQKGFLPPTEPAEEDYPDLCALSELTPNKIFEVLKMRFLKDKIYTYTANMLISINPYKFLPIYNPKYMTIYQNRKKEELAPHIYAVADTAFTKMVESRKNQCIVITGKSGSGKTQATHFLVHHTLALCQKSYMTGVEHMLIGCGPVLEAFGNAQTEHNNNSSRFGKFLRIYFYESGLLSGADIQTYLLEKSRLVHQESNERNFHIFYYLLCGAKEEELKELQLDRNMQFEYVNQNNMMSRHEAASELDRLRQAMEVIGFFKAAQKNIFKLISAILLLGNITFRVKKGRDEALEIEDESYLESVSSLLALDPALVKKCLLTRKAKAGAGERFVLDLKLNEAKATRDAMAKALYQNLFEWTVNSTNMALAQRSRDNKLRSQSRWIGLLDIFGFEDFVKNSFEQFCINYASEHLQHYCIKHTFQIEQEEYRKEGLTWKEVDYADNSGCLELYEKKPMGLFYLIDENFPGANNQTLLSQFNRVHSANPHFESPVVKEDAFIIKHYAGKVKYRIKDFREKNHDQVRDDITTLLRATKSSFIQEVISKSPAALFHWSKLRAVVRAVYAFKNAPHAIKGLLRDKAWWHEDVDGKHVQAAYVHKKMMARLSHHRHSKPPPTNNPYSRFENGSLYGKKKTTPSRSKRRVNSISQQYQASMTALLHALEKADPYFVRCIQPNNRKVPLKVDEKLILHQLRCSGTLQTIKLEQSRYPERLTTDRFLEQYPLLFSKGTRRLSLEQIKDYLLSLNLSPKKHFQMGETQVFLRNIAFHALRDEVHKAVLRRVVLLQAHQRGHLARKNFLEQKRAATKIQSFWRMIEAQREIEEWHLAAAIIQVVWRRYRCRKLSQFAKTLQAYCRGYLTRERLKIKREMLKAKREEEGARIIQRAWKHHRRRRDLSALAIQSHYRGFQARKNFQKLLKEHRMSIQLKKQEEMEKMKEEMSFIDSEEEKDQEHSVVNEEHKFDQPSKSESLAAENDSTGSAYAEKKSIEEMSADATSTTPKRTVPPDSHSSDAEERGKGSSSLASEPCPEADEDAEKLHELVSELSSVPIEKSQLLGTSAKDEPKVNNQELNEADKTLPVEEIYGISSESNNDAKHDPGSETMSPKTDEKIDNQNVPEIPHDNNEKLIENILPSSIALNQPDCNTVALELKSDLPNSMQMLLNDRTRTPDAIPSPVSSAFTPIPLYHSSKLVAKRIDQPPPKAALSSPNLTKLSKEHDLDPKASTLPSIQSSVDLTKQHHNGSTKEFKVGDIFLKAAFPNGADRDSMQFLGRIKPEKSQFSDDSDVGDGLTFSSKPSKDSKKANLKEGLVIPEYKRKAHDILGFTKSHGTAELEKKKENGEPYAVERRKVKLHSRDNRHKIRKEKDIRPVSSIEIPPRSPNSYTVETTFSADNMDTTEIQLSPNREIAQLQKEWLAFQRVEHERQLQEIQKRMDDGPKRENKQERKIREEITTLRLEHMSMLKEKLESFGIGAESMPNIRPLSRKPSERTDPGIPSPPVSPITPTSHTPSSPVKKEPMTTLVKTSTFNRSSSMESIRLKKQSESSGKPRRQRSNSAIEMHVDMRAPSSDPISRKANSLNAEAFAKKCMEEEKLEAMKAGTGSTEKLDPDPVDLGASQPDTKRGSAFMENMRKRFWGSHRGQSRQHSPLTPKKSNDSSLSTSGSTMSLDKTSSEDVAVKVRSTVAEQFSPKLLVSKAEELTVLNDFIRNKISSFDGSNLVDQVFKSALNEFCANLIALYSLSVKSGSTNGLRYKDIVSNFRQVLEKNAKNFSLDQYAAMMAVNGFRGYMNEFMNDELPKHILKEARAKKKKGKDDGTEMLGHKFTTKQWGITQICEFCGGTMWLMESGFMCKVCKYACHKKCLNKLVQPCPGPPSSSPSTGKNKSRPKKLFGESLISLGSKDSMVPVFVDKCISYMEANGIYQEGIYRRSAAATQNKQLAEALNKDVECQKVNFDDYSIHSVASCFKKFLRSLPQPLIPDDKYFAFLQASKLNNDREKIASFFSLFQEMPENNHATLERIIFHLARVAEQEHTNRMSPSNLAIVFTPCFFTPPSHVPPVDAAEHVGTLTKGVELIIIESVRKLRSTLECLTEIENVESSTNERLKQIRQSQGKGKKKRIRPSFREGPRSPTHRRPLTERRGSLRAVEEDSDLAQEEQKCEMTIQSLKSRKESLTTRLPALKPQLSSDEQDSVHDQAAGNPYCVTNEYLRHLNKHRVSGLPARRRPAKYSSSIYAPHPSDPPAREEGKPLRKVSGMGKLKRLTALSSIGEGDSFRRTSQLRNPIHRPHKKKNPSVMSSPPLLNRDLKLSKFRGTMV